MTELKKYYLISPAGYGGVKEFEFTYSHTDDLTIGDLVEVPLGRETSLGIVTGQTAKPSFPTKPVSRLVNADAVPPHLVALARWLYEYYCASPKSVWQTMLPRGITRTRRAKPTSAPPIQLDKMTTALTSEQAAAIKLIKEGAQTTFLLQGVTGSGKTQVYIELTKQSVAAGKSVIVLVPEIALTPQIVAQFRAVFGDRIIANHSKMTEAERHKAWDQARASNAAQVVIGPRSSLFLPLDPLGLIIIDEAHETSYKQEQAPRYQTTAVGAKLAHLTGAKLVLGTATPGLNELFLAQAGRIGLARLTTRANRQPPPPASIIDLRDKSKPVSNRWLSEPLLAALKSTLENQRQSLLFLNRRGSASSQLCSDCGQVTSCPNCQLPLTFHADSLKLICHYCNYQIAPAAICPNCHSQNLRFLGGGTKRIEAEVARIFPSARLARLDKDSATPEYMNQVYADLHRGNLDILIGTQMIAKGLDLSRMDLVGVISADTMLHIPDYTASERTFQLISQVSGRAGRGDRPGQVIIQSYTPDHPAIVAAAQADFASFASNELDQRKALNYPPYVHLLKLSCVFATSAAAQRKGEDLVSQLKTNPKLAAVGPAPAFREQAGGKFHWQVIVKSKSRSALVEVARLAASGWTVDLDPGNLL